MNNFNPLHMNAKEDEFAPVVLMPGDPLRAKYIADKFLTDAKEVTNTRGMLGFTGYYKGKKISVMASGMGMGSMSIYAYELFAYYNVKVIIRVGTCGVQDASLDIPQVIIANGAYTENNFAYSYDGVDEHFIYSTKEVNDLLITAANMLAIDIRVGNVSTSAVFGPYVLGDELRERIPKEVHPLAEEMEAFALFYVAKKMGRSAACMLTATDNPFTDKHLSSEERLKSLDDMIELALETAILI